MTNEPNTATSAVQPPAGAMDYDSFLIERNAKIILSEEQQQFLDKTLLTLSAGALGLMLTFLHNNREATAFLWSAYAGLLALVGSLLSVIITLLLSQQSISKHIDALDEWCRNDFVSDEKFSRPLQTNTWATATKCLNVVALTLFVIGALSLSGFVVGNLSDHKEQSLNNTANAQQKPIPSGDLGKRGVEIKPPPPPPPPKSK